MQRLAAKFKYIKFLKIRAQQAIENWPERNVPTVFVYYEGDLKHQMITLQPVGGKTMKDNGEWNILSYIYPSTINAAYAYGVTAPFLSLKCIHSFHADMEWWLSERRIVTTSDLTEDPRSTESGGENRKQVTNLSSQSAMRYNHAVDSDEDDYDLDNV